MVSTSDCGSENPGSIPGSGNFYYHFYIIELFIILASCISGKILYDKMMRRWIFFNHTHHLTEASRLTLREAPSRISSIMPAICFIFYLWTLILLDLSIAISLIFAIPLASFSFLFWGYYNYAICCIFILLVVSSHPSTNALCFENSCVYLSVIWLSNMRVIYSL